MSDKIIHNGKTIVVLADYETPQAQCRDGDLFITHQDVDEDDGSVTTYWWVSSWDGVEAWPMGDEPFSSKDEAITGAMECADQA